MVVLCVDTEKKGGGLASAVYSYKQHGDPMIRGLVQHMLAVVSVTTWCIRCCCYFTLLFVMFDLNFPTKLLPVPLKLQLHVIIIVLCL